MTEKYKTKELTEKYDKKLPKEGSVNIFAAQRRSDKDNKEDIDLKSTTFKYNKNEK